MFYMKEDNKLVIIVILYVDDTVISGKQNEINDFKLEFGTLFTVTYEGQLNKNLGV